MDDSYILFQASASDSFLYLGGFGTMLTKF